MRLSGCALARQVSQHWDSLDAAGRRDWLRQNGWKVTAIKDDEMPNGWRLAIDPGWTAGIGIERQAESFGAEGPEDIASDAYALADALKRSMDS